MTCKCGHRLISHRFHITTRRNQGECLAPGCPCTELEESA